MHPKNLSTVGIRWVFHVFCSLALSAALPGLVLRLHYDFASRHSPRPWQVTTWQPSTKRTDTHCDYGDCGQTRVPMDPQNWWLLNSVSIKHFAHWHFDCLWSIPNMSNNELIVCVTEPCNKICHKPNQPVRKLQQPSSDSSVCDQMTEVSGSTPTRQRQQHLDLWQQMPNAAKICKVWILGTRWHVECFCSQAIVDCTFLWKKHEECLTRLVW